MEAKGNEEKTITLERKPSFVEVNVYGCWFKDNETNAPIHRLEKVVTVCVPRIGEGYRIQSEVCPVFSVEWMRIGVVLVADVFVDMSESDFPEPTK